MPRSCVRRAKNVGIILWAMWSTLDVQMEPALDQFEKWGVKGIKVDFMQRDDQPVIDFYHRIAREAASARCWSTSTAATPALMTRTWPNVITTEGVKGLEHIKWTDGLRPRAQRHAAVHAHGRRTDGLHAGRDAQRRQEELQGRLRAAR